MPGSWPDDVASDVHDLVRIASGVVGKRYWRYVPIDDIKQAVATHVWRNREKITEYLRDEDRKRGWAAAMTAAKRAGERYARKVKADLVGYKASDEFFYDKALICEVIRFSVTGSMPTPDEDAGKVSVPRDPAEGGNLNAMLADVNSALAELEPGEAALLTRRYGEEESIDLLAKELEVSRQAVEGRLDRHLKKVLNSLGGESPYRKV